MRSWHALLVAVLTMAGVTAPVAAANYYDGKTITFIVGFSPGGGTDRFARLVAEHMGRHIDGKPAVIVQNMPGAGSVLAANYYVDRAPRDGSELMVGTGQLLMRILLGLEGSTSKLGDYAPLMSIPMGRITYVSTGIGATSATDLRARGEPLILGVPEIISTIDAVLGLELLGVKVKPIVGYKGKSETRLAFEQGEVDADGQTTPEYMSGVIPLVEQGKATPLFSQGLIGPNGDLVRDPAAPDLPTVAEVYQSANGKAPSGPVWSAYLAAVTAIGNGGKILMVHKDAPTEGRAALLAAVDRLAKDADFLAAAEKALEGYPVVTGADLQAAVDDVAAMSQADIDWLKEFLSHNYEMKFN